MLLHLQRRGKDLGAQTRPDEGVGFVVLYPQLLLARIRRVLVVRVINWVIAGVRGLPAVLGPDLRGILVIQCADVVPDLGLPGLKVSSREHGGALEIRIVLHSER